MTNDEELGAVKRAMVKRAIAEVKSAGGRSCVGEWFEEATLDAIADAALSASQLIIIGEVTDIALMESMKAPQSLDHSWDRGYRAGAAAVWSRLRTWGAQ